MANKKKSNPRKYINPQEDNFVQMLDELTEFEDFQDLVAQLRTSVKDGATTEDILKLCKPYAAARLGNIVMTAQDAKVALAAIKELLARTDGTPTQKQEITHKYADLTDDELEAMIRSEEKELADMETNTEVH